MHETTLPSLRRQDRGRRLAVRIALSAGAILALGTPPASAQDMFAGRPIRMVVSVGAGGATDTLTRILAERMAKSLGTPVLVENQPGGSGVIAAQAVARAAPDGHTLLIGTNTTHAGNASFIKNLPYDPVTDFEPITRMGIATLVLSVNSTVPVANVRSPVVTKTSSDRPTASHQRSLHKGPRAQPWCRHLGESSAA